METLGCGAMGYEAVGHGAMGDGRWAIRCLKPVL